MSDYLEHLAARNLNPSTDIQPRLPGLFEPPQPHGEMRWIDFESDIETPDTLRSTTFSVLDEAAAVSFPHAHLSPEGPGRTPRVDAPLPAISTSEQHEQNSRDALRSRSLDPISSLPSEDSAQLPHQEATQSEQGPADPAKVIASPKASTGLERSGQKRDLLPTPVPSTDRPAASSARPEENVAAVHSPVFASKKPLSSGWMETKSILEAARSHVQVEPSVSRQTITRNVSSEQIERAFLRTASTEEQSPSSTLSERQAKAIEGPTSFPGPAGTITVRPAIKPARPSETGTPQRPESSSLERAESLPEPIIHVTIGRVEVRAVPPIQTKREPSPKPSVLGLDEYLQRFERKR